MVHKKQMNLYMFPIITDDNSVEVMNNTGEPADDLSAEINVLNFEFKIGFEKIGFCS